MWRSLRLQMLVAILASIGCIPAVLTAQQTTAALQIVSPAQGTVVAPGQAITVVVTVSQADAFSGVAVIGQNIGYTSVETSGPFSFSLYILAGIVGPKTLTAVGITTPGNGLFSQPITIDLEPPTPPTSLSANISTLTLDAIGEQFPLTIGGTFADGSTADLTQSSYVTYSSSNNAVATIDATGTITATGTGSATVVANYAQTGQSFRASVSITVLPPLVIASPLTLSFGNQNVGTSSAQQTATITNSSNSSLNILSVTASPGFTETDTCTSGSPLPAGSACTIQVTFAPTADGTTTGTLNVVNNLTDGAVVVSLTGIAVGPAVGLSAQSIVFSSQDAGTTSGPQVLTVTNTGGAALTISSVETSAGFIETDNCVTSSPISAGGRCNINVQFTPTVGGIANGVLTINDNAGDNPQGVSLAGNAIGPYSLTLSTASLTFAAQPTATTSTPQSVTITNTGSQILSITSIAVTGTNSGDFAQTNNCGTSVAVGTHCTITVTFTPTATGSRSGSLTLTDNATGSPQVVGLSGTGTAPGVSLSTTSVSFGNQPVGTTSTATPVTVTNNGTASLSFTSIATTGDFAIAASGTTCSTTAALAAGSHCVINVTFTPTATGNRLGSLTLTYNAGGSPQAVNLSGTGTASATAITWTLNATLSDGATVTGYFVFNPNLGSNQSITNFNINVSAPTPGTLSEPGDDNLPTSVFSAYDFTPANSLAGGPRPTDGGSFAFISNSTFPNPITGLLPEQLVLSFVPISPLTDASSALINNSNINVTSGYSGECFDCDPYVTFANPATLTSTTALVVTPAAALGSLFTLTATVQNQKGNPVTNGSVTFYDGTTALGTVQVVTTTSAGATIGTATLKTILVPLGANSLTAKYVAGGGQAASTSPAVVATVTGTYPTTTTLASSGTAGDYTLTGTVAGAGPLSSTGNVVFTDNTAGLALGTAALNPATAAHTFVSAPTLAGFSNPVVMAFTDANGDGIPDLFMGDSNGLTVALGNGDGTFQTPNPILSGAAAELGLAFGDFNGDGKLDAAYATDGHIVVLLGNGNGTFQAKASYDSGNPRQIAVGDFNGDGILDLVALNTGAVDLLLGNGDGTFQNPVSYTVTSPLSLAVGDLNGDGNPDVVVGASPNDVTVFLGNGNGTLQTGKTFVTQYEPGNLLLADLRGVGKLDLVTVFNQCCEGSNTTVSVMLGNGDGTLQTGQTVLSGTNYSGLAAGDFNGDGKLDLVVSNYGSPAINILPGNGDGTFQSAISHPVGTGPITPAVADLNHDGRPDIAVANFNDGTADILLNHAPQTATLSNVVLTGTGNHSVTGAYAGDTNFAASTSNVLQLAASPAGPMVSFSPASLTFAPLPVGTTSASQPVALTNTGKASLSVSSIAVTGDFAVAATGTTCSTSAPLAAGGNCLIAVTFKPTASASRAGSLSLTDNAPNSPQALALSGTGQDFSFAPSSASSSSASVAPGSTASYALSVGGEGGLSGTVSFTCSGAPAEANCTVSPNPVMAGSSPANVTVSVTTTAASLSTPRFRPIPPVLPLSPGFRGLLMVALYLATMACAIIRRMLPSFSGRRSAMVRLAAGLLLTLALAGCGGGGGGGGGTTTSNPGTPAGTYTLTVTATTGSGSSALSHNLTLTLTVS